MNIPEEIIFPIRINRYLALKGLATRKGGDQLIAKGQVLVNGKPAVLGQRIEVGDEVTLKDTRHKEYRYIAYYKPRGIITHSPQRGEKGISDIFFEKGIFPVGRLDKASEGLIILTNDGRVTERLLHPRFVHEKEYQVRVRENLRPAIVEQLVRGVESEGEKLSAKSARLLDKHNLVIVLTQGKKHQIRRMLGALHCTVEDLLRVRIMNILLGRLKSGEGKLLKGQERDIFLKSLGLL